MKAATSISVVPRRAKLFQSTPPVKAATAWKAASGRGIVISIHAAREGGDEDWNANINGVIISIHAAREGGDCGNE